MEQSQPIIKNITVDKYTFVITDNTLFIRDQIYCRNIKIGGVISDCVNISVQYRNNQPISASIPFVSYDHECALNVPLDKGNGTILMIKTLLEYLYIQLPMLTEIEFEDKSNIECATETEMQKKSKNMKKGTNVFPIPLYYFSIAFNGETWYEKHFDARQSVKEKHDNYKKQIQQLLHSTVLKNDISFIDFLRISQPPLEIVDELENIYEKTETFGEFFQKIPKKDRCRLVRDWISTFIHYFLKDVFSNTDWILPLPIRSSVISIGGKQKQIKTSKYYYCPRGKILYNKTYRDFGVNVNDV